MSLVSGVATKSIFCFALQEVRDFVKRKFLCVETKIENFRFFPKQYGHIFFNTISVVTALYSSIHNFDTNGLIITLTVRMLIWSYCFTTLINNKKGLIKNIYFFLYCLIFVTDFWTLYW